MKCWMWAVCCAAGWWLLSAGAGLADNWPQWRGPQRDAISRETGLLQEWPEGGPKLLWQSEDIGDGYGTPSVVDGRLYVLSNRGLDDEFVKALNVETGKEIWSTRIGRVGNPDQRPSYPAARSTPTVEGDLLYALGSDGDLVCLKTEDGSLVWQKSLRDEFKGQPGIWAYSESPLVDGDRVVITPGGNEATVVALNKQDGTLQWKTAVPGNAAAYASVITVTAGDVKQYVVYLSESLVGLEAKSGKLLWKYGRTKGQSNMPTPISRDNLVYSGTSRAGGALVELEAGTEGVTAEEVYFNMKLPNSIGGSVLVGDSLYGCSSQALMCVDFKTGELQWENRSAAPGAVIYADQRLYLHSERGEMLLAEATPEEYRELGRFTPPDQPELGKSKTWAPPMIAHGRLYIRQAGRIWCYDIKAGG